MRATSQAHVINFDIHSFQGHMAPRRIVPKMRHENICQGPGAPLGPAHGGTQPAGAEGAVSLAAMQIRWRENMISQGLFFSFFDHRKTNICKKLYVI